MPLRRQINNTAFDGQASILSSLDVSMRTLTNDQRERLLDALPCYAILLDRDRNVLWANPLALRDFRPSKEKKCWDFFGIDKSRCTDCPVQKTLEDGQVHSKEIMAITGSGSRITLLEHSSAVLDNDGRVREVLATSVDITPIKEIQKQLILLGETVAGMAHSIKNIMMGLEGGIYVVNKGIEAKNQNEVKEGWEMVLLNFDKISHIVTDVLYCSKDRVPDFQLIKPNELIRQVYDLFNETARRYHVEVKLDLDEELKEAVMDPSGLHTVLSNLVSNALDACKLDIWKDSHLVEIRSRQGKFGTTIVEVADNGVGIDKSLKTHVFEDFFSSKGDQGTGLGLMVTQKIMREHGGNITFRSRPGRGTTFVATFPSREMPSKQS
jgi:signal transduction histidine kinase